MADKIFLISDDDTLTELVQEQYVNEDLLQTLLEKYPDLIPGDQINETDPRRWLLVSREMPVLGEDGSSRLSLDHLYLDQDAIPTLVEVKRSTDSRIRREVVGQMLDYAANAVAYWPIEALQARFTTLCDRNGTDPTTAISGLLNTDPTDEASIEHFWTSVKTNLNAGRIRMLFIADILPPELRRIIEFLNVQMNPAEVLGVEIRQFTGGGRRTLVPRVYGQTARAQQVKSVITRSTQQWDEPTFFAALTERRGEEAAATARQILDWANTHMSRIWWGKGAKDGSMVPVLDYRDRSHFPFTFWTSGAVEVQFQHMCNRPGFDTVASRTELLIRLNAMPGIALPITSISLRPSFPISALTNPVARAEFLSTLEWALGKIQAA